MTSSSFGDSAMGICAANRITVVASILWVRAGTKSMRTVRRSPLSVITQWNGRLVKCAGMATDLMLDRGDPAFQLSDTSRTVPMRPDSSSINGESSRAIKSVVLRPPSPVHASGAAWAQSEADRRTGAFNRCHTDFLDPRWDSNNGIRMSQISRR